MNTIKKFNEISFVVWLKYLIKFNFFPSRLPTNSVQEIEKMKDNGIYFVNSEIINATNIVSKLRPYKEW